MIGVSGMSEVTKGTTAAGLVVENTHRSKVAGLAALCKTSLTRVCVEKLASTPATPATPLRTV